MGCNLYCGISIDSCHTMVSIRNGRDNTTVFFCGNYQCCDDIRIYDFSGYAFYTQPF